MGNRIDTVAGLEAVIGERPPAVNLKVIDHLDESALRWLEVSPLAFVGVGGDTVTGVSPAGGSPGFANGDEQTLRLPLAALDDPALAEPGLAFASLFLAPGFGETLRINGRVGALRDGELHVTVEECYMHCAKALIRSEFWAAEPLDAVPGEVAEFVSASRFLALATVDAGGAADLSPKGDPAGGLARLEGDRLTFADRPGNRRTDSFRNILAQPRIAGALLVPGSHRVALLRGAATLTIDASLREAFAVRDKVPRLAIEVTDLSIELRDSRALERARPWPVGQRAGGIEPAKIFASHVRLNKHRGLGARVARAMVSVPGLLQKGLDKDYKDNLY